MKKLITSVLAMTFIATSVQAADIVVDSYGTGDHLTLQTAINAANPGDRIFVVPHATAYAGDLFIDKSIELLSQAEGQRFNYQGIVYINITNSLPANSSITIQSMNNLNGSITSYYAGTGDRNRVNIVNCKLHQGNIVFDQLRWDVRIQNDSLMNGFITLRYGRVTGCYVNTVSQNSPSITINSDVNTDDYIYIVGNKIAVAQVSAYTTGINWTSTTQYFYFANNYIYTNNYYPYMVYCATSKTGSAKDNLILNNTFNSIIGYYSYAVYITNSLSPIKVENNLFAGVLPLGIYGNSAPLLSVSYNHFNTDYTTHLSAVIDNGTNEVSAQTIDAEGQPTGVSSAINGGDPDASHRDLDDTINDAGCFGGSYSRANFLAPSSGARTAFVIAPRRVIVGQPIDIFAEGFDY